MSSSSLLGAAYINGAPVDPTEFELNILRRYIETEFSKIPALVVFQPQDITLTECKRRFSQSGKLYISIAHNIHPYLSAWDNAKFRAIHDWHHLMIGVDDSMAGEFAAYEYACETAPKCVHWMLHSEIAMQAAAYYLTGEFQPQKFVKMGGF